MANRKKKPSRHQQEKLAKAQYRNEFLRKLKNFFRTIFGEKAAQYIPETICEDVYRYRGHSMKITPEEGHDIPNVIMDGIKVLFNYSVKKPQIPIMPGCPLMSMDDFFKMALPACIRLKQIHSGDFPNADKIEELYDDEKFYSIPLTEALKHLEQSLNTLGYIESEIGKPFYWLTYSTSFDDYAKSGISHLIKVSIKLPEIESVKIDNIKRPVIRVGWPFSGHGVLWPDIATALVDKNCTDTESKTKIYFQSHALKRFNERIDCPNTGLSHFMVYISFSNPRVVFDRNHAPLIEYRMDNSTAGYFVTGLIEGKLIVKTFLFVTNSGTPEGLKLEKSIGLQKLDKKFLAIDKLSSFLKYDIHNNLELQKVFTDAGCECLISLHEESKPFFDKIIPDEHFTSIMLKYLKQNEDFNPDTYTEEIKD